MGKMDKWTKQGIRDLGGNRKPAPIIPTQTCEVDIGIDGVGGMVLEIQATSLAHAIERAQYRCDSVEGYDVLRVKKDNRIIWGDS